LILLFIAVLLTPTAPMAHESGLRAFAGSGPQLVVLQPGANGTDAFVTSGTPLWNFGDNASLLVGPNATSGYLNRALLRFDVGSLPANATILNATLALYEVAGSGGVVQVRRALNSWTEGNGGHSWTVVPVTVRETAGVNRTLEPVEVTVSFLPNAVADPLRDLRVYDSNREVPSQVYGYVFKTGYLASARVDFDVTVRAFGTKTYHIVYSTNGTGIPSYRTATWSTGPVWTYGPTGGGASGATVADLDNDGHLDIFFGGTDGYVYCLDDAGNLKWRTLVSPGQSVPFTPQVADVDRSGQLSVVVSTNAPSVVRLNRTGAIVWTYNSPATLFTTPTLVDVNGDGVLDALVGSNNKNIAVIDGRTGTLLTSLNVPVAGYTATIADIDGNGRPEILVDGDDKLVHAFALNGTQLWASAPAGSSFLEGTIAMGDINGDGFPEVVTGDNGNNGLEFALWASNGTLVWSSASSSYREGGQTIADLTGSGALQVLFGVKAGGIYGLRGADGSPLWTYNAGTTQSGTPVTVDLDRSGTPQIVFIEGASIDVLTASGSLAHNWTITPPNLNLRSTTQYPMTSPAVADLTGNGTLELLVPTANGMSAFGTGGLDRDWRTWGYNTNHTQRFLDGASGTGASLLQGTIGVARVHPADGVSWNYRDGVSAWNSSGGDLGLVEASASTAPGWVGWNITGMIGDWISGRSPNQGLFLTEGSEVVGSLHGFVSSDSSDAAHRPRLTISYVLGPPSGAGQPPKIVGPVPNVSLPENAGPLNLNLTTHASDNDTPLTMLRWNVTGLDPAIVTVAGTNVPGSMVLTIQPRANVWGDARARYWLTDPEGRFDTGSAWINVTHVDAPPTFNPPTPLYVRANATYRFDFGPYINDPDTPAAQLSLRSDDAAHTSVQGTNVSFLYPSAYLDRWAFVNLTVSDGQYAVTRLVAVKVTLDDPPVLLTPLPNVTMVQGQLLRDVFNLSNYFTDPNHDALFYSTGYTHLLISIRSNLTVDIQAPSDWWGIERVTFRASDPTGALAEDTMTVMVLHVDAPPALGPIPNLVVRVGSAYSFNLAPYASDPDTPVANLTVTTSDPIHVFVSGLLVTLTYPLSYNGTTVNLTVFLSDGTFAVNRTISVSVGTDSPPIIAVKMPDVAFAEGTVDRGAYDLTDYFADPDGSLLFWSVGNSQIGVTIHPNGTVDLTSFVGWWGTESVTFRATDVQGALQEDTVRITVVHVDRAPYFRPVPTIRLNVTATYVPLTAYLGDPDNNLSQLVLVGTNSSHATIIGQGILLSYSSDADEFVELVVSDGTLANTTSVRVVVALPVGAVQQVVPGWLYWSPVPIVAAALATFLVYRRRQLEWAFLVTNAGLLVSSVSRRGDGSLDTDLLTGMLTTIMDFAKQSFSDEKERNLEGLELGEKRVGIVRGDRSYLAVVYRGNTPGSLTRRMRALLAEIEREHATALGDVIDTSKLGNIPLALQRLVTRGGLPFIHFTWTEPRHT